MPRRRVAVNPAQAAVQWPRVIVATYNINGVNGRLSTLLAWLANIPPDVVCLDLASTTSWHGSSA
jgi:hypothetical protein